MKTLSQALNDLPLQNLGEARNTSPILQAGSTLSGGKMISPQQDMVPLRQAAQMARAGTVGPEAVDQELKAILKSRKTLSPKLESRSLYSEDGGFMGQIVTVQSIGGDPELLNAVGFLCEPSEPGVVMREVYGMWSVMAKRAEDGQDFKAKQAIFADELRRFPQDIIISVCRNARRVWKFFPTLSEILKECETIFNFRKSLWEALKNPSTLALETIGHYREIHRTKWKPAHYLQKITDLIGFADVHKKNHKPVDELSYLLTAQKFIEEVQAKLTADMPETLEIYRLDGEIKTRAGIIEKRLAEAEPQQQTA